MHSVIGIFKTRDAAHKAATSLGLSPDRVDVVAPPPLEPEDKGIGPALGSVMGGVFGLAAGSPFGLAATLIMGAGGAVAGVAVGEKAERAMTLDHAHDPRDVFFYHEALRRGRAIVLALADNPDEAERIRRKLSVQGAQDLDVIRETWWNDLREKERAGYDGDFERDEREYRRGFESALMPENRNKALEGSDDLPEPYRKGYARGYQYLESVS